MIYISCHLFILFMCLSSVPLLILLFSYKCFLALWFCCSVYLRHIFIHCSSFSSLCLTLLIHGGYHAQSGYFLFTLNVNFLCAFNLLCDCFPPAVNPFLFHYFCSCVFLLF